MKTQAQRYYLSALMLVSLLLCSAAVQAQLTLSISDAGTVGDFAYLRNDTTRAGTLLFGSKGPNQTWNFANISGISEDTVAFIAKAAAPSPTLFPAVNVVLKQNAQYTYINRAANGLFIHGLTVDFDTLFGTDPLVISPPLRLIGFPATFGNNFSSTGSANIRFAIQDTVALDSTTSFYIDSVRIVVSVTQRDSINGWGSIQMPAAITVPALRQETWQTITPNVEIKIQNPLWGPNFPFNLVPRYIWIPLPAGILPSTSFTNRSVNYWTTGRRFPIVTFTLDSTDTILTCQYQTTNSIVAGLWEDFDGSEQQLYPNPTVQKCFYLRKPAAIRVVDIHGKQHYTSGGLSVDKVQMPMEASGLYFVYVDEQEVLKLVVK
jgi:hypothetical protein